MDIAKWLMKRFAGIIKPQPRLPEISISEYQAAVGANDEEEDTKKILSDWRSVEISYHDNVPSRNYNGQYPDQDPGGSPWPDGKSKENERWLLEKRDIRSPWRHGDIFGDAFHVVGLRAGGSGVVYFVSSTRSGKERLYAAKTLQSFLKSDFLELSSVKQANISKSFLEEAVPWLDMGQHPHIVPVLLLQNIIHPEFRRNIPFVFSRFKQRGNLKEYLHHIGRLSLQETLLLGIQLCDGLMHAYDHGIQAHLDLKPENILVHDEGLFQITDFTPDVFGTPGYASPEQVPVIWQKKMRRHIQSAEYPVDRHSDQYSIGVVLLESLLGTHPFPYTIGALDVMDIAQEYVSYGPGSIPDSDLHVPLREIISQTLCLDPSDRFKDLPKLREHLLRIYEQEFGNYTMPQGDIHDSFAWLYDRGITYQALGRNLDAQMSLQEAFTLLKDIPETNREQATCLANLGIAYTETGKYPEAEKVYMQALELLKTIPRADREQANCIRNLGTIDWLMARFSEAESSLHEALALYENISGAEQDRARCLMCMGLVHRDAARPHEAEKAILEAMDLLRDLPATERELADCTMNLGTVFSMLKRYQEAEESFLQARDMYQVIPGTHLCQAHCLVNLSSVCRDTGRGRKAEAMLGDALSMYGSIQGTDRDRADCLASLGNILIDREEYLDAEKAFLEAGELYGSIPGTGLDQARCSMDLAVLYTRMDRIGEAESRYEEALDIFRSIPGSELYQARCCANRGIFYAKTDDKQKSIQSAREALFLCDGLPEEATAEIRSVCRELIVAAHQ